MGAPLSPPYLPLLGAGCCQTATLWDSSLTEIATYLYILFNICNLISVPHWGLGLFAPRGPEILFHQPSHPPFTCTVEAAERLSPACSGQRWRQCCQTDTGTGRFCSVLCSAQRNNKDAPLESKLASSLVLFIWQIRITG